MSKNQKWAIIVPVHKLDSEEDKALLKKALASAKDQETDQPYLLQVIAPLALHDAICLTITDNNREHTDNRRKLGDKAPAYNSGFNNVVVEATGSTSFQSMVNQAVAGLPEEVKHFTILEFDDTLRPNYAKWATKYAEAFSDTAVFLPLVEDVTPEGGFLKFTNEVLWTPNFSDNLGYLDHEALKGYANFHLTGALIKKDAFLQVGGLKESIELTFNYEFLLRLTQLDLVVTSIPKVLYAHVDGREGSLFKVLTEGRTALTEEEIRFWFDVAHRECLFTEDRKVTFQPSI